MTLVMSGLRNELLKLFARKKYFVFLVIEIGICLVAVLAQSAIMRAAFDGAAELQLVNLSLSMLTFFIQAYIPLVIFMAACDLFASEVQENTLKVALMRPVSRMKVFVSKVLAVTAMAFLYMLVLFLATMLMEAFFGGGVSDFWTGFGAYLLDLIPLFILVLMAALINQLTQNATFAMFLSILIYLALVVAGMFIPQTAGLLFTGYMQWHNVWLGSTLPFHAMASKILLLLGYAVVFFGAGFFFFDRREV